MRPGSGSDLRSAPVPLLREDDHVRGPAGAPLVLVYGDFTCPRCAPTIQRLHAAGSFRVAYRHFALRARDRRAPALAHAAEAAGRQGAFWAMHDALFADQARTDDPHLWARCERLGLDVQRFEADRRDAGVAERVAGDVRDALRAGATATPTLWAPDDDGVIATMHGFGFRDVRRLRPPTEGRARKGSPYEQ